MLATYFKLNLVTQVHRTQQKISCWISSVRVCVNEVYDKSVVFVAWKVQKNRREWRRQAVLGSSEVCRSWVSGLGLGWAPKIMFWLPVFSVSDPLQESISEDVSTIVVTSFKLQNHFPKLNPHSHPLLGPWRPEWCTDPMGALRTGTCLWITECTTATPPTPRPMANPPVLTLTILTIHIWQQPHITPCHPPTTPLLEQPHPPQFTMGWKEVLKVLD